MKPLVIDLFCGLGGWAEAFLEAGYRAVGFDIEAHDYGNGGYPGELVLRDIRTLTGEELVKTYGIPSVIVASPPCQEFSYMAMPWTKAKQKEKDILANPKEKERLCELFNHCFRIQKEVSACAGRYIPLIIENVRGAQKWVGKARWNFGSFYLWGDVPALMPFEGKFKSQGLNWSDQSKRGQDFTRVAGKQNEGIKALDEGYDYPGRTFGWKAPRTTSKCKARKEASAMIAKIPAGLAGWIAKCYGPAQSMKGE